MISECKRSNDPLLSIEEVAILVTKAERTTRENCVDGRYRNAYKDPTGAWIIPLSSLPPLAQAKYWAQNLDTASGGWKEEDARQLPEEEIQALWAFLKNHPRS